MKKTVVIVYKKGETKAWKVARLVKSIVHEAESADLRVRVLRWEDVDQKKIEWDKTSYIVFLSKPKHEKTWRNLKAHAAKRNVLLHFACDKGKTWKQHHQSPSGKQHPTEDDLLALIRMFSKMQELDREKKTDRHKVPAHS